MASETSWAAVGLALVNFAREEPLVFALTWGYFVGTIILVFPVVKWMFRRKYRQDLERLLDDVGDAPEEC